MVANDKKSNFEVIWSATPHAFRSLTLRLVQWRGQNEPKNSRTKPQTLMILLKTLQDLL